MQFESLWFSPTQENEVSKDKNEGGRFLKKTVVLGRWVRANDGGLTPETSALKLFAMANLRYQLSSSNQITLLSKQKPTPAKWKLAGITQFNV